MRASKHGWSQDSYRRLLCSFGFLPTEGGSHTIYKDPDDSGNFVTVPRHKELKPYVAEQAIAAIERRIAHQEEARNAES